MNIAVKCTAHSKAQVQGRSQEAQDVSVAWLQNSSVVLVLEVSVCMLWRCVDHCECWTCAWLLSLIVIVLTLLCTTEPPGTKFTVRPNTTQPIVIFFLSLTVYNSTSWRQNVADFFDIQYVNIQDLGVVFFFFAVIGLVYTVVCVYGVFLKLPARRRTSTGWDSVYCIVTYLPWYFRLTLWLSHDSAIVTWPRCRFQPLFTDPSAPSLLCSVPFPHCLFPKVLHGVNMAFPNACDLHFKPPNAFVLASSCLSPCGLCKLIFLFHLNYWHFVFIGCKSWLKWLYLMVVVLLWGYSQPDI